MAGNNPVFNNIQKQLQGGEYAGIGEPRGAQQRYPQQGYPQGNPQQGYPQGNPQGQQPGYYPPTPMSPEQLDAMYQRPSAGPLDTGRVTFDDVIMKTLTLFAIVLSSAAVTWVMTSAQPALASPIWMVGMFGGLVVGLIIAFKKTISVPLILTYSLLEGAFVGALSRAMEAWYPGIVMTAVVATLATFAGMFIGYRTGVIKVTSRSRRIFGMAIMGYMLFSLVNVLALVFGYKGRKQIDESNGTQTGRGMATAGIVLGWVNAGITIAYIVLVIVVAIADSVSVFGLFGATGVVAADAAGSDALCVRLSRLPVSPT